MSLDKILFFGYGVILLVGGFIGYKSAGSKISLYMGIIFGILTLIASFIALSNAMLGAQLIAGISGILVIAFFMRFIKTNQFMPAGMLLVLSSAILILTLLQIFKR